MSKDNQTINIRSDVVRDPNITVNDFSMILYLKYMVWRSGSRYRFEVLLSDMKNHLCVSDNKTLKPSYANLYKNGYLLEEVGEIKPNKPILFTLNEERFNTDGMSEGEFFTQLPISILYGMKDGKIDRKEVRLLYYLKSYINHTDLKKHFCYTGIENTMVRELNMSDKTIPKYTKKLVDKKLIRIERHDLKTSYQYREDGTLIFNKYNNHYYLEYNNILSL